MPLKAADLLNGKKINISGLICFCVYFLIFFCIPSFFAFPLEEIHRTWKRESLLLS